MKKNKKLLILTFIFTALLLCGNTQSVRAESANPQKLSKETTKLFQTFLSSKKNNYFKITSIKGSKEPVLLISDAVMGSNMVINCDIYIVKTIKKNGSSKNKLVKAGHIQSNSGAYSLWKYENRLICGSHHYTTFAEIKNGKLYINCYAGKFDKKGKETFYHLIYSGKKLINKKQISSAQGQKYIYDMWKFQTEKNILIFYKNTKENRVNYI